MGYDRTMNELGYGRIGIYYIDKHDKPINFCDVHMFGGPDTLLKNVRYGGPSKSASQSAPARTERQVARWLDTTEASDDNDISDGGAGLLVHQKGESSWDCWLFGPVKYLGRGYPSLLLKLRGWRSPTWTFVKDPGVETGHVHFQFPTSRHFQPCALHSTDFVEARITSRIFESQATWEKLQEYRKYSQPVGLPDYARKIVWKLEAGASLQTEYQYMTAKG